MPARFISLPLVLPVLLVAACLLLGGCASTYDDRYAFDPHPASIETFDRATDRTIARTLVSIVGVRQRIADQPNTPAIDVRMLIENVSDDELLMPIGSLRLVSADVRPLDPPLTAALSPVVVAPHSTRSIDLRFPFPKSSEYDPQDLSGLNLRWTLERNGVALDHETSFKRVPVRTYYERVSMYPRYPYRSYWVRHYHGWHVHSGFHYRYCW